MADVKITALTAISLNPVNPATFPMPMVDLLDTTMAASGSTRKVTVNQILGSGGTATLASATITGDLTVDTSTLKVDSTNDNVIVGATSAIGGGRFSVQADLSAKQGICVKNSAASYGASNNLIRFTNSSDATIGGITHPAVTSLGVWGVTETKFLIGGAATTAMTLNASGNLAFPTGKGIDFSAVTGGTGTATANVLNDYEEGTWVGTLTGGTTNPTVPVTATGRYTKVGRQVSVQIAFEAVSTIGASGNLSISGLPFANAALRVIGTAGAFTGATFTGTLISQIESSGNIILFYGVVSNAAWASATHNPSAGTFFWANLTYTV